MNKIAVGFAAIVFNMIGVIEGGYVLSRYWAWFIAPVVQISITWKQAIGFMLTLQILLFALHVKVLEIETMLEQSGISNTPLWLRELVKIVFMYPVILFMGWLWSMVL